MTQESLDKTLGLVRHILSFAGGYFVTSGTLTESTLDTGIGAIVTLIGVVWSIFSKNKVETN
jgi:hypothetical protein